MSLNVVLDFLRSKNASRQIESVTIEQNGGGWSVKTEYMPNVMVTYPDS